MQEVELIKELEQLKKELEELVLYNVSLSDKELFYSNFMKWLIGHNKEYARVFFDSIDYSNIKAIERESSHTDLKITLNDESVYLIENKLKGLAYKEQLKGYKEKTNSIQGCYTGFMGLDEVVDGWHYLSLKDMGEKLKEIAKKETDEYIRRIIEEFSEISIKTSEYVLKAAMLDSSTKELKCISMNMKYDDIVKKIKSNDFRKYVNEKVKNDSLLKEYCDESRDNIKFVAWEGFYRAYSVIDFRLNIYGDYCRKEKNGNIKELFSIGLELKPEGNKVKCSKICQWDSENKKIPETPLEKAYPYFESIGFFQEKEIKEGKTLLFNRETDMSKKYNQFWENVIYQHYYIEGDEIGYEKLSEYIIEELRKILGIILDNKLNLDFGNRIKELIS